MKLARPDIRHPRIVLVGSEGGDDAGLVAALRKRGLHARWLPWDDPDTLHADLVILRASTDYGDRLDEFLAWTRRVARSSAGSVSLSSATCTSASAMALEPSSTAAWASARATSTILASAPPGSRRRSPPGRNCWMRGWRS